MTVVESTAEAPDQTAVSETNESTRLTKPQKSQKHHLTPESGRTCQFQATPPRAPRNRTATFDRLGPKSWPASNRSTRCYAVNGWCSTSLAGSAASAGHDRDQRACRDAWQVPSAAR